MFEKMRHPGRGREWRKIVNYTLFGFICLIFVFVGLVNDRSGLTGIGTAATVNDSVISAQEFQETLKNYEMQSGSDKGMSAAQRQMRDQQMRARAIEGLVEDELRYQSAKKYGILPTPVATRDMIVTIPAFQDNGRFSKDYYRQVLAQHQMTPADFEGQVERQVVMNQVREMFLAAWMPPDLVNDLSKELKNTKISYQFVKVDAAQLAKAEVTDKEVSDFLAKPENKTKVKSDYDAHSGEYQPKEQVRAHHILLKGTTDAVLTKINDLKKQADAKNFSALAKQYSEDLPSKVKGGDLGYFDRHQMVPEFTQAAFEGKPGTIVGPIKTQYGYHLIFIDEHKTAPAKPYDQIERDIATRMVADQKKDQILADLGKVVKDQGGLEAALSKYHLKWEDGGDLSAGETYVPKLGLGEDAVNDIVTTQPGSIHGDLIKGGGIAYIVKVKSVSTGDNKDAKPAAPGAFDESAYRRYAIGGEILNLWADDLKKDARIEINQSLVK